ncbi:MAG: HAMP domain-containing sensor histidine kinase [Pseudomonadota bacterium]|nr:HAMP domain-containing sensor histidine kinase [Pseudomonadota bacterium]
MLYEFLLKNQAEILAMTEQKSRDLAGHAPTSEELKRGLPIFYDQLMAVLLLEQKNDSNPTEDNEDKEGKRQAARNADEPSMAAASGRPGQVEVAKSAGRHGQELFRLGYTLSHVVHAYGAMCQSITELSSAKNAAITSEEFHDLNHCLDVAIAGAVTEYASQRDTKVSSREVEHLGFLAHELRNTLNTVVLSYQLIKSGTVTPGGNTGQVLERGLKRISELIDRSLTEVRMRVDPKVHIESAHLFQLVDHILLTAEIEAKSRNQTLETRIDPTLVVHADQQLLHSALSNLIQNALKYTHDGGKIQVRGNLVGENIIIEVEDEYGGLSPNAETDLFKPFEQQNWNRKGLGLGLTIAQRGIVLNHGSLHAQNLPEKGCIFRITLPKTFEKTLPGKRVSAVQEIRPKYKGPDLHALI